jgi:decaprenyl-phosphate phosphoribosyltransferase
MNPYLQTLRPTHWHKNLIILAVPLAAGSIPTVSDMYQLLAALLSLVAISGAVYAINDVVDEDSDRAHPVKRTRPLAAGAVSRVGVLALALSCVIVAAGIMKFMNSEVYLPVGIYLAMNVAYSFGVKQIPYLEAAVVALGFGLRLLVGSAVLHINLSQWLLGCIFFGSLMIVIGKRISEAANHPNSKRKVLAKYTLPTLVMVSRLAGLILVAIYIGWFFEIMNSDIRRSMIPLLLSIAFFGGLVARYLTLVRSPISESPELLVVRDRCIVVLGVLWLASFLLGYV